MAIEAIYGEPMYVGLIRGTVITANTFSSKSAFRAQLVNVLFCFVFQRRGSLSRQVKLDNSVGFFIYLFSNPGQWWRYSHSP